MAKNNNLSDFLKDIADKIRSVFGISGNINPQDFVNYIQKGEDVTSETNSYTSKIASLETAITALETELAGKAAGGGSTAENCTVTLWLNEFDGNNFTFIYTSYVGGTLEQKQTIVEAPQYDEEIPIYVAKNTPLTIHYPMGNMYGAINDDSSALDDATYIQENGISLYNVLIVEDTYIELNPDY